MVVVSLSAMTSLTFSSAYPIWSIMLIAVDVLAIYALAVHGAELQEEYDSPVPQAGGRDSSR
jgi:hypothetical protein